jgi:hypothetical protein
MDVNQVRQVSCKLVTKVTLPRRLRTANNTAMLDPTYLLTPFITYLTWLTQQGRRRQRGGVARLLHGDDQSRRGGKGRVVIRSTPGPDYVTSMGSWLELRRLPQILLVLVRRTIN